MNVRDLASNILQKSEDFAEVLSACRTLLKYHPLAEKTREYLDNRISPHYQDVFKFGYFPSNENISILTDLVPEKKLRDLGLIYYKKTNDSDCIINVNVGFLNHHNLIMPYKDSRGNIIALVGRTILSEQHQKELCIPKYKNTVFYKSLHMFGLYQAKKSIVNNKSIIIVEGQFDCISCHAHGFHNVVALGGTALSKYQFSLLRRYTNNIYLLLDTDTAGTNAANKIFNKYSKLANIQKIQLPKCYKDIDEYLKKSNDYSVLEL